MDIAKLSKTKDESVFSSYYRLWVLADYFVFEPLMKDAMDGFKECCAARMKIATDLKRPMELAHQNELVDELAYAVESVFQHQGHPSTEFRNILTEYAFSCRLRFFELDKFASLLSDTSKTTPPYFGRQVLFMYLQAREIPRIGHPGAAFPLSKQGLMSPKCSFCEESHAKARNCFHGCDFSRKEDWNGKYPIVWKCDKCVLATGYPWVNLSFWKAS